MNESMLNISSVNMSCIFDNNNTCNSSDDVSVYTESEYIISLKNTLNTVQRVVTPVLLLLGITGNIFTILTVSHAQFRRLNSRYILCALAVSDSLLLLTNPFNQLFMINLLKRDLRALSNFGCKLFIMVYRTGKMSASWLVVLVAMERFVAVLFPLKVKFIMRRWTIQVLIAGVYIFMLCLTGSWSFSTKVVGNLCKSDSTTPSNRHIHKSLVIVGATFYSLAPICLLVTLTPPIIIHLIRNQRFRQQIQANATGQSARDVSKTTVMLIALVINYVVCVTPITMVLVLSFWTNEPLFEAKKPEKILLLSIGQIFEQINHSANFVVYIMCSGQFRYRFIQMIRCRGRKSGNSSQDSGGVRGRAQIYTTSSYGNSGCDT